MKEHKHPISWIDDENYEKNDSFTSSYILHMDVVHLKH